MAEFIVITDHDKQISAIVDVDNRIGYGPAMIGPDSERLLEGFLLTVPYDLSQVDTFTLRDWFADYAAAVGAQSTPPPATPDTGVVEPAGHAGVAESHAAEREAVAEPASPPPPQPADTDMEGDEGETPLPVEAGEEPPPPAGEGPAVPPYEVVCWNCEGKQFVPGPDGQPVTCGVCKGTGHLPAPESTTA